MIAVADASPLCYLILIGEIELLPKLFTQILTPKTVLQELGAEGAPKEVRAWAAAPPPWLLVQDTPSGHEEGLQLLQGGERAAILLAESAGAEIVLVDEKSARGVASGRGLAVTGVLGVLLEAADRNLVELLEAIGRLTRTNFRYSPALLRAVLERHQQTS